MECGWIVTWRAKRNSREGRQHSTTRHIYSRRCHNDMFITTHGFRQEDIQGLTCSVSREARGESTPFRVELRERKVTSTTKRRTGRAHGYWRHLHRSTARLPLTPSTRFQCMGLLVTSSPKSICAVAVAVAALRASICDHTDFSSPNQYTIAALLSTRTFPTLAKPKRPHNITGLLFIFHSRL